MSVKDKTQDICEMAVKLIAKNIMHVPEELRTYELWKIAITKDAKLFDRCPFRDNAITILAVKGCHKNATIAKNLTDLELVKSNPLTIQYIKNKTDEILFHVISVDEKYIAYARGIPLLKAFEIVDMYPGTGRYFNIGFSDRKILDFYYNIKLNTTPYVNKHFFNNIVSATKENPEIFKYTVQIIKKFYRSKLSLFIELT